jgi:hypothetical protein
MGQKGQVGRACWWARTVETTGKWDGRAKEMAEMKDWIGKPAELVSRIWFKDLDLKFKDSNTFKPNLDWGQTKINLNKLLEDFLNMELLKNHLNIQIQAKALNQWLLKWFGRRFWNGI